MMDNAWQLAVVDYSLLENVFFKECKKFASIVEESKKDIKSLKDGEVVYIVGIVGKMTVGEVSNLSQVRVWIPRHKRYGFGLIDMLRPIITEKDVVEAELKFSIKLDDYVQ